MVDDVISKLNNTVSNFEKPFCQEDVMFEPQQELFYKNLHEDYQVVKKIHVLSEHVQSSIKFNDQAEIDSKQINNLIDKNIKKTITEELNKSINFIKDRQFESTNCDQIE